MNRYIVVPLIIFLSGSVALATCPTVTSRVVSPVVPVSPVISSVFSYPTTVTKAVVVKPIVKEVITPVAVYAPIPVLVPVYGASYTAPVTPPAPAAAPANDMSAALSTIMGELRKINARIDALERRKPSDPFAPAPTPAAPTPAPLRKDVSALEIITNKCSSCHDATNSAGKGGGLTLLEKGALAKITDKQCLKLIKDVKEGRMPKKSSGIAALTDEEYDVVVTHYTK
jgi:hypothetical protein